jgi:hypothetical protein
VRQYTVTGQNPPPVAYAGANKAVLFGANVQLNGTGSLDYNGQPLTYQWSQLSGPTVILSSPTAAQPTFTAPASNADMVFQLVVNDGQQNSIASTVTVSATNNVAQFALASASSESTGTSQTADKAIDGVIDGYPGDYTKEWSTVGGGAGSWLKLTSASATPGNVGLSEIQAYNI